MNNQYGLDEDYFRKKLKQILKHLDSHTPEELARSLGMLALVSHEDALLDDLDNLLGNRCNTQVLRLQMRISEMEAQLAFYKQR